MNCVYKNLHLVNGSKAPANKADDPTSQPSTIEAADVSVPKCSLKKYVDGAVKEKSQNEDAAESNGVDDENVEMMFNEDMIDELKGNLGDQHENGEKPGDEADVAESDKKEAVQLFQQGKRSLLLKDFESACDSLGAACEKYNNIYGQLATECAEVLMYYGQALLESWKDEEILNKKEAADIEESGTNDDIPEEKEEVEKKGEAKNQNGVEESNEQDESKVEPEPKIINGTVDQDETIDQNGEENVEEDEEDDVDNLQLAWEVFETAKAIYQKDNDNTNLAKLYTKLGEVSVTSGNYETAIDDLNRALDLYDKLTAVNQRQLADVHLQLHSAYLAQFEYVKSENELRKAKNILDDQVNSLDRKLKTIENSEDNKEKASSEIDKLNNEMKEIQDVISELNMKLQEVQNEKRKIVTSISNTIIKRTQSSPGAASSSNQENALSGKEATSSSPATFSPVKADVPVNDISHLVRKKPKMLEEEKKVEPTIEDESNEVTTNSDSCGLKRKAEEDGDGKAKKVCVSQD